MKYGFTSALMASLFFASAVWARTSTQQVPLSQVLELELRHSDEREALRSRHQAAMVRELEEAGQARSAQHQQTRSRLADLAARVRTAEASGDSASLRRLTEEARSLRENKRESRRDFREHRRDGRQDFKDSLQALKRRHQDERRSLGLPVRREDAEPDKRPGRVRRAGQESSCKKDECPHHAPRRGD